MTEGELFNRITTQDKLIEELKAALTKISEKKGYCIYGSMEISDDTDPAYAFRHGSEQTYYECASIADEALAACKAQDENGE